MTKTGHVFQPDHLPVGVSLTKRGADRAELNHWWMGRSIPASRSGIKEALNALGITAPQMLLTKCMGLSLSDHYWMNPADQPLDWEKINFFDHPFSGDVGNALFGKEFPGDSPNLMSPDNTSDGWLRKKWTIAEGKRCLLKGGSAPFYQEPLNEVLASMLLRRLNIPHVSYQILWDREYPMSVCEDFISRETELVSAWSILQTAKKENSQSLLQHFLGRCECLAIPGMSRGLDQIMTLDFLLANTDRHFHNFGAVRNPDTLEWLGPAPIFDSGTSMWHDQLTSLIQPRRDIPSRPFRNGHSEQIKLVSSFSWLDPRSLEGVGEEWAEELRKSPFVDSQRRDALRSALKTRVELLERIALEREPVRGIGLRLPPL